MNLLDVVINSERLRMIPTSDDSAQDIFKEFNLEITKYMSPRSPKKIEDTFKYIKSSRLKMEKGEDLGLTIFDKKNGEFLGQCGLHRINTPTPEIGIWVKIDAQGNSYGKEAVTSIKNWCDENIKYKYITYPVDKRNISSRKIAESLGGVVKREFKKTNPSGKVLDEIEYWIYPR